MKNNFLNINKVWSDIKKTTISEKDIDSLKNDLGEDATKHFLSSGLIGITHDKIDDIKCIHAQIADTLLRGNGENGNGNGNIIGALAIKKLKNDRGIDPSGCSGTYVLIDYIHIIIIYIFLKINYH